MSFCCYGETLPKASLTHKKTQKIITALTPSSKREAVEIMISGLTNKNVEFDDFLVLMENIAKRERISYYDKLEQFLCLESPIIESRYK